MKTERRTIEQRNLLISATAFIGLACVAILALGGWREWATRASTLQSAEIDTANITRSLTEHAEDSVELADAAVVSVVHRLETEGFDAATISHIQEFFRLRKPTLGRIRGLFVYGESGEWLASSESIDFSGLNNSDRDYFHFHRQSKDRGVHIGRPVRSRSGGQWVVTVSRRVDRPDGSFAGVVLATIDVAYLVKFYGQFNLGERGAIALLSSDGILLARSPDEQGNVGRDLSSNPLFRNRASRSSAGTYYFKSPIDGMERLSFYKFSERYPLVLITTESQDDVLRQWWQDAIARMGLVFCLVLLIAGAGLYFIRQLLSRQRMLAALAANEANFRLLAEESGDMVTRIALDERVLYASPSSMRVLGWSPEQLLGTMALTGVNPEDLPRVREAVESLKHGEVEEARIIYRTRHGQKSEIWVETTLRVTTDPLSGKVDGVVAILRDMTAHKGLVDQLRALATTDGLTGLANRRYFDEVLEREWARAKRDGIPLSILMLDVDHFKKFNDTYGHQSGDDCLRRIAHVLAEQVQRPGDLAARYGGEEFVVLMPNIDRDGCETIGEKIRSAVGALNIGHAQNMPSKIVTVSAGGASALPGMSSMDFKSVVEAADKALYSAKESGRDQMVMSGRVVSWRNTG